MAIMPLTKTKINKMKKLFFALVMTITLLTSCTETEVSMDDVTGTLKLETVVETGDNEELKSSVNRGTVPVYVAGLDIKLINSGSDKTYDIDYVDDNTGADEVLLKDAPLSSTNIEVTSKPVDNCNLPVMFFELPNRDLVDTDGTDDGRDALLSYISGLYNVSPLVPYAEYYGDNVVNMTPGNSNVSVNLDTDNGRDFGTIVNNSDYRVVVTLSTTNSFGDFGTDTKTVELGSKSDETIGYYWSNEKATANTQGIKLQFTWYDAHGEKVKTDSRWRIISKAKESYWGRLSITNSDIRDETLKSMFTFEEIVETGGNTDI